MQIRGDVHCYSAVVGSGLIEQVGTRVHEYLPRKTCAIISDNNVAPLFADQIKRSFMPAGFKPIVITIPGGEKSGPKEFSM